MKKITLICCILFVFFPILSFSKNGITLKPHYPTRYVVKSGDTLWDIANMYLKDPGQWKKLWHANPQVVNPDIIYPGAELVLRTYKGHPSLEMVHNGPARQTTPFKRTRMRTANGRPIPTIPLRLIKPFLDASQVFDSDILATAPYVVGFLDDHIAAGEGNSVYVKDLFGNPGAKFSIYRPNGYYRHPITGGIIGFQADHLADGEISQPGEPATFYITASRKEVHIADRLLVSPGIKYNYYFVLQQPGCPVYAQIISLINAMDKVGTNQIVVISAGAAEGLVDGDMLGVFKPGDRVQDPLSLGTSVLLPSEKIGDVMIFRTFHHVSYGLIMRSRAPISMMDLVQTA